MSAFRRFRLSMDTAGLAAVLIVGLAVIAATVSDYGISWDEPEQCRYAERTIAYFQSWGKDKSCNDLMFMKYNNTLVDLSAAILYGPFPRFKYVIRHTVSAALALLTVPAIFRFGKRLGGEWAGLIGGLFLVTSPPFYGHAFVNTKDVPFACFFAWTMDALASLLTKGTFRLREFLVLGLAAGLTAAVRPGGLVLVGAILALAFAHASVIRHSPLGGRRWPALALKLVAAVAVTWTVMVAPWPWAHENVLLNPWKAVRVASSFPNVLPVFFNGREIASNQLPWYYLLEYFVITTPLPLLALASVGVTLGLQRLISDPRGQSTQVIGIGLLWSVLPVAVWTATRSNIYDGLRHFLFIMPSLAAWAGYGGFRLCGLSARRPIRAMTAVILSVAILWPVEQIVRLHPYQITYYNEIVGGLSGASKQFETEYWLTSYKEAIEWVNDQARRSGRPVGIGVAALDEGVVCARFFCDPNVVIREANFLAPLAGPLPSGIDYYVATTRLGRNRNYPDSRVVKRIGREGATFTVIKAR